MTGVRDCFVVVLGMSPTGLYAVRELGSLGVEVFTADTERMAAGYSRYLSDSGGCLIAKSMNDLMDSLTELARKQSRQGILMPTSDKYIEFIVQNSDSLSQMYLFQSSYANGLYDEIVDKGRFALRCKQHGIPHPHTWTLHGTKLASVTEELSFPCILKPTLIHLVREYMSGQKVLIVRDRSDFLRHLRHIEKIDAEWMVQEIIPGAESRITLFGGYFSKAGELQQAFSCRKLRQYPAGFGSASLVRSERLEDTLSISETFLKALGFEGVAGTEFKYDERDQQLKIIEINPRPTLWFGCSNASGKRIVSAAVHDLLALKPVDDLAQAEGVEWRYLAKDYSTQLYYRFRGENFVLPTEELSVYGKPAQRVWAVFSWQDPLPVVGELLNYFRKFFKRILSRAN